MGKLDGKISVITGANSGIGLASAKRFAREGARVFMTGRRKAELDKAVAEVGGDARGVQGDVANLDDLDRLYSILREEAGRIDVLFANAGGGEFMPLPEVTEEHYDRIFATNVKGTLFTCAEGIAAAARWRVDHLDRFDNRQHGWAIVQRVQRQQGGRPQLRAELDSRSGTAPYPCERPRPGCDLHTGLAWAHSDRGAEPCVRGCNGSSDAARPDG